VGSFTECFDGKQIYDGASFINGSTSPTPTTTGTFTPSASPTTSANSNYHVWRDGAMASGSRRLLASSTISATTTTSSLPHLGMTPTATVQATSKNTRPTPIRPTAVRCSNRYR
jgi:hypothetical protein